MSNNKIGVAFNWRGKDETGRKYNTRLSLLEGSKDYEEVKLMTQTLNSRLSTVEAQIESGRVQNWSSMLESSIRSNPFMTERTSNSEEIEQGIVANIRPGARDSTTLVYEHGTHDFSEIMPPYSNSIRDDIGMVNENVEVWVPDEIKDLTGDQNWSELHDEYKLKLATMAEEFPEEVSELLAENYQEPDFTDEDLPNHLRFTTPSTPYQVDITSRNYEDTPLGALAEEELLSIIPGPAIAKTNDIGYLREQT